MSKDIILLQGKPGSGKTSCSLAALEQIKFSQYDSLNHYSIGNHLRDILANLCISQYAEKLKEESEKLQKSQKLSNHVVGCMVGEYIGQIGVRSLTIFDGYPLYIEQIPDFQKMLGSFGVDIIGLVEIEVPREVAVNRIAERKTRPGEVFADLEFAVGRVEEHMAECEVTTRALSKYYRTYTLDGTRKQPCLINDVADRFISLARLKSEA